MAQADRRTTFEHADPILRVDDMPRALQYYVEVLGFVNADWGSGEFTCVSRGAHILHPPENHPWALEMKVGDPDGHVLRFGSEPRSSEG